MLFLMTASELKSINNTWQYTYHFFFKIPGKPFALINKRAYTEIQIYDAIIQNTFKFNLNFKVTYKYLLTSFLTVLQQNKLSSLWIVLSNYLYPKSIILLGFLLTNNEVIPSHDQIKEHRNCNFISLHLKLIL